jgi:hypothetical protein
MQPIKQVDTMQLFCGRIGLLVLPSNKEAAAQMHLQGGLWVVQTNGNWGIWH